MVEVLANIIAALVTIPLLGFVLVFFIVKKITKNKKRAMHLAIDWSTLLLIFSVHHSIFVIWQKSFLWLLFLLMVIVAIIFALIHYKTKSEMEYKAIFKGFWRMNFLLFFSAHIFFVMFGMIQRINLFLSAP
jgi:hypothetical protein